MTTARLFMRRSPALLGGLLLALGVLAVPEPAFATVHSHTAIATWGEYNQRIEIHATVRTDTSVGKAWVSGSGMISRSATTANRCKITSWLRLRKETVWESPRSTFTCDDQINLGRTFSAPPSNTGTSAYYAKALVCIDLYYGASASSGWHACAETSERQVNEIRHG